MSKKTIAIIGATGDMGSVFSKNLAKANYRLLLFAGNTEELEKFVDEIRTQSPSADIEAMGCAADASWEADIIIPDIPCTERKDLTRKIEQFSNRKIVIAFSAAAEVLQALLPGARIVKISSNLPGGVLPGLSTRGAGLFIEGGDQEAIDTTMEIMQAAGFGAVHSINSINQSKINTMASTKWNIDSTHSEIQFKVRHLMVSWVTGSFNQFNATVETDGDDISTAKVHFTADINSISTNNEQRDAHLKNADFFDAENHPQLSFESEKLEKIDGENYKLYGKLTLRGTSKPVVLSVEYGGLAQDPWGNTRIGFSVSGKLNRKDFGVSFGMVTETGGLLLGDEVTIHSNVEFVKQVVAEKKAA